VSSLKEKTILYLGLSGKCSFGFSITLNTDVFINNNEWFNFKITSSDKEA